MKVGESWWKLVKVGESWWKFVEVGGSVPSGGGAHTLGNTLIMLVFWALPGWPYGGEGGRDA